MRKFKDIKVGDIVCCNNLLDVVLVENVVDGTSNYETYILYIESVKKDKRYVTQTNPEGIVAYGKGFTEKENAGIKDAGYSLICCEKNFQNYVLIGNEEKIHIPLNNDMTRIVVRAYGGLIYAYTVIGTGKQMTNEIVGFVNRLDSQQLFEWSMEGRD